MLEILISRMLRDSQMSSQLENPQVIFQRLPHLWDCVINNAKDCPTYSALSSTCREEREFIGAQLERDIKAVFTQYFRIDDNATDALFDQAHNFSASCIGPLIQRLVSRDGGTDVRFSTCDFCSRSCGNLIFVVPDQHAMRACMDLLQPYVQGWAGTDAVSGEITERTSVALGVFKRSLCYEREVKTVMITCGVEGIQLATSTAPFWDKVGILTMSRIHSFSTSSPHQPPSSTDTMWELKSFPWSKNFKDCSPLLPQMVICSAVTRRDPCLKTFRACSNPACSAFPKQLSYRLYPLNTLSHFLIPLS